MDKRAIRVGDFVCEARQEPLARDGGSPARHWYGVGPDGVLLDLEHKPTLRALRWAIESNVTRLRADHRRR